MRPDPAIRHRLAGAAVLLVLLSLAGRGAAAQDSVIVIDPDAPATDSIQRGGLPPDILSELLHTYNDSTTLRLSNEFTVPPGTVIEGRVAAFRGPLRVAGTIAGPLVVINGDLVIQDGGRIEGDVLVAGGRFTVDSGGTHLGAARVYWDAAPVYRLPDGDLAVRERRRPIGELAAAERTFRTGSIRTTLRLATTQTYNRIEGLPILFGPAVEWRPSRTLAGRVELRGILRTAGDNTSSRRDLGYQFRTDWRLHGPRGVGLTARVYDVINGIEEQTLPRDEIGWAAVLLQRDNRDYYSARGVSGGLSAYLRRWFRLDGSIRYERQGSVRANDPWSLFRNTDRWRANPLIDDGHYTVLALGTEIDTRNNREYTTSGWWLRGSVEHAWSNDVAPVVLPLSVRDPIPTRDYAYQRFSIDARRYTRLTPGTRMNFRLWAGGWLGGDPLPIQRRLSLGGLDFLPGYEFRAFTCAGGYHDPADPALCDRAITVQTEFRTRLSLGLGYHYRGDQGRSETERFIGIDDADLVFFGDGGKAWLAGSGPGRVPSDRIPSLKEWKADVGLGLDAGSFGVYLAKAVTDGEPVRVFVRLVRRF